MASSAVIFTWGQAYPGREEMGLGVFGAVLEYNGKLQAEGKIERFDTFLHGGGDVTLRQGTMTVVGTSEQIMTLFQDETYQKLITKAAHVAQGFGYVMADTGDRIPQRIGEVVAARKEFGISK